MGAHVFQPDILENRVALILASRNCPRPLFWPGFAEDFHPLRDARLWICSSHRNLYFVGFSQTGPRLKVGIVAAEPVQADMLDRMRRIDPYFAAAKFPAVAKGKVFGQ